MRRLLVLGTLVVAGAAALATHLEAQAPGRQGGPPRSRGGGRGAAVIGPIEKIADNLYYNLNAPFGRGGNGGNFTLLYEELKGAR